MLRHHSHTVLVTGGVVTAHQDEKDLVGSCRSPVLSVDLHASTITAVETHSILPEPAMISHGLCITPQVCPPPGFVMLTRLILA